MCLWWSGLPGRRIGCGGWSGSCALLGGLLPRTCRRCGCGRRQHIHAMAAELGADGGTERTFLSERHQIVIDHDPVSDGCEDLVQRMIYRADLPYRKEFSAIRYPAELNRRPGWLTAVGPYVSVVCGHQRYIENAIFASAATECPYVVGGVTSAQSGDRESRTTGRRGTGDKR